MLKRPAILDTTVLLYLGRINQIDFLPALFDPVYVPESVILELDMGRLLRRDTVDPRRLAWVTSVSVPQDMIDALPPHRLGVGEQSVIAYAYAHQSVITGLDDLQARRLAEGLGLTVVGTLGVLLRATKANLAPAVRPLVDAVIDQGFRLSPELYREVLKFAGEL